MKKEEALQSNFIIAFILVLISFGVYLNTFRHKLTFDDKPRIVENGYIKSLSNINKLFNKDYNFYFQETSYRPLYTLSLMLSYQVCRLSGRCWFLSNAILHTLVTILLFFLLKEIFNKSFIPFFSAFLFAIHPIHTAVLNVAVYRTEILAGLFFLLSLYSFLKNLKIKNNKWYYLSLLFFFLGVACKESIASLPLFLCVYIWMFVEEKQWKRSFISIITFFLIVIFWVIIEKLCFTRHGLVLKQAGTYGTPFFAPVHLRTLIYVIGKIFPRYLWITVLPVRFVLRYPQSGFGSNPSIQEVLGLILIVFIIVLAIRYRKKAKIVSSVVLFFFITLIPVSYIFPMNVVYGERWLYIPSMGICLLVGFLFDKLIQLQGKNKVIGVIIFLCVSIFYGIKTNQRNHQWADIKKVFQQDIKIFPKGLYNYLFLADEYLESDEKKLALKYIQIAHKNHLNNPIPYYRLTQLRLHIKQYPTAVKYFYSLMGDFPVLMKGNFDFFYDFGKALILNGQPLEALAQFEKAKKINPYLRRLYNALGNAYVKAEMYNKAVENYNKAINIDKTWIVPYKNLITLYSVFLKDKKKQDLIEKQKNKNAIAHYNYRLLAGLYWGK